MIPTLHPFADLRYRETPLGAEAEMNRTEALAVLDGPAPDQWWEYSNWASALYLAGRTREALRYATYALSLQESVATLVNMAVILECQNRFREALVFAERAYRFDPTDNRASALYGESLIRLGRMAEGWPLYAQARLRLDWIRPLVPEWGGAHQDLRGKRLLVIEGGGFGDNLFFFRHLHTLRRWGTQIDYLCQPSFAPLVRSQGFHAIENWSGNVDLHFDQYDYCTSILQLGEKLGWSATNYRWTGPYIKLRKRWRLHQRRRIGLCWRAGESNSPRRQRFLHNEQRDYLIGALLGKCTLVNLTYRTRLANVPMAEPSLDSWLDTARAVATCDLVVSVDTGVAHLAGAMGVPVWVILPGSSAWQYLLDSDCHPFYPSMRLFRNRNEGMQQALDDCITALETQ